MKLLSFSESIENMNDKMKLLNFRVSWYYGEKYFANGIRDRVEIAGVVDSVRLGEQGNECGWQASLENQIFLQILTSVCLVWNGRLS